MQILKLSALICAGILWAGLAAPAMSQDPPPRDAGKTWDNGPAPAGAHGPARADGARHDRAHRDGAAPPGPPQAGDDRDGPPPADDDSPRRGQGPDEHGDHREHRGPDGPAGPNGPGEHGPHHGGGGHQPRGLPFGPPMDFEALKTRDPELYQLMQEDRDLERQSRDQAEQYRTAGKEEQGKIKEKLDAIVEKHFAVRQQLRTLEVKRLDQQIKDLREMIEQREKNRKEIVKKRVDDLVGPDERDKF